MFGERKTVAKQHVKLYHKRRYFVELYVAVKDGFGWFLCVFSADVWENIFQLPIQRLIDLIVWIT